MSLTECRLQEETAKVEEHLLALSFEKAIMSCFSQSKADAFEKLLDPLQKMLRLSPPVAATLVQPEIFYRTGQKLSSKKAVVRGDLLRIVRSICDASEDEIDLLRRYGLHETIEKLSHNDPAILVRNIASELLKSSDVTTPNGSRRLPGGSGGSRDDQRQRGTTGIGLRRTSSSTGFMTKLTPSLYTAHSSSSLTSPQSATPPTQLVRPMTRMPLSSSISSAVSDYSNVTAFARGENLGRAIPQQYTTPGSTNPTTPVPGQAFHVASGRPPRAAATSNPTGIAGRFRPGKIDSSRNDGYDRDRPGTPSSTGSATPSATSAGARSGPNSSTSMIARNDRQRTSHFSASTASTDSRPARPLRTPAGSSSASPSTAVGRTRLAARQADAQAGRTGTPRRETLASPARMGSGPAAGASRTATGRSAVLPRREKDAEALAIARKRTSKVFGVGKAGAGVSGGAGNGTRRGPERDDEAGADGSAGIV